MSRGWFDNTAVPVGWWDETAQDRGWFDRDLLIVVVVSGGTGQIGVFNGGSFVLKPVKWWNGSAWVTKPLKRWTGAVWATTA